MPDTKQSSSDSKQKAVSPETQAPRPKRSSLTLIVGLVVIIALLAVIYFKISGASAETVAVGDTIQVYYTGSYTNGTVFNSNVGESPFNFTVGANQVIEGFDQGVIGMKLNQTKTITIPPSQAYGEENSSLIVSVPLKDFGNQTLKVGQSITEKTPEGQEFQGVVMALNSTNATINFNPPLAGKTLIFQIRVVGIQK